jgi:hypothetical protein
MVQIVQVGKKGGRGNSVCVGLCKACYSRCGCWCGSKCGRPLQSTTPLRPEATRSTQSMVRGERSRRIRYSASDTESDEDDEADKYDFWKEQFRLAQNEDDDWRDTVW